LRGTRCCLCQMSRLAEIEKSVSQFSADELAELEEGSLSISRSGIPEGDREVHLPSIGQGQKKVSLC
jgi:hypothetical protein